MAYSTEPVAELAPLPKADGSATFSYGGYTVTAAVNGPIEAQRRDENAFEALVDVNIRPAAGVGGQCPCCLLLLCCVICRPKLQVWPFEDPHMKHNFLHSRLLTSSRETGTAERQLEAILQSALRQLIPVRDYPRCMIQITLQLVETPENAYVNAKVVQAQLVSSAHS
jgi:exosome complex component RRP46